MIPDELAVYRVYDGNLQNLVGRDDKGRDIVDTYDLAEMMSAIYNEFINLSV